jgi:hypothetical protein
MTIWYVNSATGLDTYNGTSLTTPFATIQKAANSTVAADTVYILPGNGYGGGTSGIPVLSITTSGTAGNPITYSGYPGSARPVLNGTQSSGVIYGINPLSYININYLELAGWMSSLTWAGACANAGLSGTGWQSNVYCGSGTFFGGSVGNTSTTSIHHISITNCLIHDFPGGGTGASYCDYITISGNTIYNCCNYSPFATSGISLYEQHNIDAVTGIKCVISGNTVYNCKNLISEHSAIVETTTTNNYNASGITYIANVVSTASVTYGQVVIDCTGGQYSAVKRCSIFWFGVCRD